MTVWFSVYFVFVLVFDLVLVSVEDKAFGFS